MKKIILVLVVLMLSAPALAGVTITAVPVGTTGWVAINYVSDANVSSFGLDIVVTGANIIDVNDFFVGECGAGGGNQGFGIFPANFYRYIDPETPVWGAAGYTPVADSGDSGAQAGLGTSAITIEMGALYVDGNQPGLSGTLCTVEVDQSCTLSVQVNSVRCGKTAGDQDAGVVLEDGTAIVPDLAGATGILVDVGGAVCCPGDVTGTVTGFVTGGPPLFIDTFDSTLWEGGDGKVDTTDLQCLIFLLTMDGIGLVVSPVPAEAACADVTATVTGFVTGGPPLFIDTFDPGLWEGADGKIDTTDLQSLIFRLTWENPSLIYTCP